MTWSHPCRAGLVLLAAGLALAPCAAGARDWHGGGHGGGGYRGGYHGGGRYDDHRGGGIGPVGGALLGLGVGAIVGGALASQAYAPPPAAYYPPPPAYAYAPPPGAYYPY